MRASNSPISYVIVQLQFDHILKAEIFHLEKYWLPFRDNGVLFLHLVSSLNKMYNICTMVVARGNAKPLIYV